MIKGDGSNFCFSYWNSKPLSYIHSKLGYFIAHTNLTSLGGDITFGQHPHAKKHVMKYLKPKRHARYSKVFQIVFGKLYLEITNYFPFGFTAYLTNDVLYFLEKK